MQTTELTTDRAAMVEAMELMDAYAGPESGRVHYLADQWTCWGDDESALPALHIEAEAVIRAWRVARLTRKIVTHNSRPPIPTNKYDWCAFFDGEEEAGGYGYGATEAEAIADFVENYADDHLARLGA